MSFHLKTRCWCRCSAPVTPSSLAAAPSSWHACCCGSRCSCWPTHFPQPTAADRTRTFTSLPSRHLPFFLSAVTLSVSPSAAASRRFVHCAAQRSTTTSSPSSRWKVSLTPGRRRRRQWWRGSGHSDGWQEEEASVERRESPALTECILSVAASWGNTVGRGIQREPQQQPCQPNGAAAGVVVAGALSEKLWRLGRGLLSTTSLVLTCLPSVQPKWARGRFYICEADGKISPSPVALTQVIQKIGLHIVNLFTCTIMYMYIIRLLRKSGCACIYN